MTHYALIDGLSRSAIDAALSDSRFGRVELAATPHLCFAGEPAQLVYANQAALLYFGVEDLCALAAVLLTHSPSSVRLNELARSLRVGLPPRTERLRFFIGPHAEYASYHFRRLSGPLPLLVMSARAVRGDEVSETAAGTPAHQHEAIAHNQASILSAPDQHSAEVVPSLRLDEVRSPEDMRAYYHQLFGETPSVRFLWQSDQEGILTSLTGPLSDAVGAHEKDMIGASLLGLAARGCGDITALSQALHRTDTFSGIEVLWRIADHPFAVMVSLGAIPSFDRQRQCDGFRGYGIVYLDDLRPCPTPQSTAHQPSGDEAEHILAADSEAPIAPPHDIDDRAHAAQDLGDNVVPLRLWQERAAALAAAEEKTNIDPPADDDAHLSAVRDEPSDSAPEQEPHSTSSPQTQKAEAPSSETASTEEGEELTPAERLAFREIARALGARTRPPADHTTPSKADLIPSAPAASSAQQSLRAERDQDMQALSANAHHLIDRLPVGILVTRAEIPLFLNRTFLDLLGFSDADAFHDAGGLDHLFRAGGIDAQAEEGAIHITDKNGATIALECRVQRIMWDDQAATLFSFRRAIEPETNALMAVLESELRRTEAETRELHAILDTATDGVAVLDHRGRILSLNRAGEALFGVEQNDVAGESMIALLAPESHAIALDYLAGLQANGVASVLNDGREVMGRAQQGGTLPIFMTIGRLQAGGETKFCAVLRDMTPWKRAESELRDARREAERVSALKSDFLAKMSHEIRTPLNAILGFAEVIMEERFGPIGNERYKDYLRDIHASGAHVMSLINDLLDLSKIEAGKLELNFTSVDANRIVRECVHLMQPQANRERVIIRQSLASGLPMLVADERALRQIVLNLLSNAIKFNEAGGQVIISTALTDAGHAVIRIRDTGIGMSESDVQTALEPFRQLATSRQKAGTGLGLPLTKALVEANRASFVIRSQKNNGTLVEVTFPPTRVLAE